MQAKARKSSKKVNKRMVGPNKTKTETKTSELVCKFFIREIWINLPFFCVQWLHSNVPGNTYWSGNPFVWCHQKSQSHCIIASSEIEPPVRILGRLRLGNTNKEDVGTKHCLGFPRQTKEIAWPHFTLLLIKMSGFYIDLILRNVI